MHRFTLTFLNKEIEQQYQSMNKKQSIEFQQQQKWIFIVMGLYFTIIKIIEQEWVSLGFIIFNWLVVIVSYKFILQRHKLYEYFLTFAVVSYNLYFPLTKYFSFTSVQNFYVDGYFISVGTFGVINIFSFRFKTMTLAQRFYQMINLIIIYLIIMSQLKNTIYNNEILQWLHYYFTIYLQKRIDSLCGLKLSVYYMYQKLQQIYILLLNLFCQSYIIIAIIFASLVSMSMISEADFWNQFIKSTIFTSLYLQYLYCSEKHKKFNFLNHLKRTTTLKGIYDLTNIQTFIIHYKTETKKIELVQKDNLQEIQKQILDDFDDYLKNMKIQQSRSSGRFTSILGQDPVNQTQRKQELKSYLFELFLRDQKVQKIRSEDQEENNQILGEAIYDYESIRYPSLFYFNTIGKEKRSTVRRIVFEKQNFKKIFGSSFIYIQTSDSYFIDLFLMDLQICQQKG